MSILWPSSDDRLAELVLAARKGDRRAFQALYQALYDPVARYVARRVGRREDAEDLVARVFHRALERLDDFDPERGNARMFVIAMARSLVVDHLRATRREVPIDDLEIPSEAGTPIEAVLRDEAMARVRAALEALGPEAREILVLRYGDGLRHHEIAELLGLRVDAVKQRASRALREVRARVEEVEEKRAEGASDVRARGEA